MKNKAEIVEFAKELYLTPDEKGNHKYSLQQICDEILRKFDETLTKQTISNWVRKYGWDKLWDRAVKEGITESIGQNISKVNKSLDEVYVEAIAKKKKEDLVIANFLKRKGYEYISMYGFSNTKEALEAIRIGLSYDIDTEQKDNEITVKIVFDDDDDDED